MDENRRSFSHDKAVILNALYDALERLSFTIDSSNSSRGTLVVSSQTFPELGGRIAVSPLLSTDGATVEVFPAENGQAQAEWIAALYDEVGSLLKMAKIGEKRK